MYGYRFAVDGAKRGPRDQSRWANAADRVLVTPQFGWTQGIREKAIFREPYTYIAGVSGTDQRVIRVNKTTGAIISQKTLYSGYSSDDHNVPGMAFTPSGKLIAVLTGHNNDGVFRFYASSDSDPANFGAAVSFTPGDVGNVYTYPMLFVVDETTYWLVARRTQQHWDTFVTTDSGATWSRKKSLIGFTEAQGYLAATRSPSVSAVVFYGYSHMVNGGNKLVRLVVNFVTGAVTSNGSVVGNLNDGTNATPLVAYGTAPSIFTADSDLSINVQDQTPDGTMVLLSVAASAASESGLRGSYWLGRLTGANPYLLADWTWTRVAWAGGIKYGNDYSTRGIQFDQSHTQTSSDLRLFVARTVGSYGYIERITSTNGGASWAQTTLMSSLTKSGRLHSPTNASIEMPLLWHRGEYVTYTNFPVELMAGDDENSGPAPGLLVPSVPALAALPSGVLCEYFLNEGTGQELTDSSGNGRTGYRGFNNTAEATRDPNWTSRGLQFRSSTPNFDIVEVPYNAVLATTTMHMFAVILPGDRSVPRDIANRDNRVTPARSWFWRIETDGRMRFIGIGGTSGYSTETIPYDAWVLVECLVSGGTAVTYRINGRDIGTATASVFPATTSSLFLGATYNNNTIPFQQVNEMAYFAMANTILTGADLAAMRQRAVRAVAQKGLWGFLPLAA